MKKIILAAGIFLLTGNVFCQSFMHGVGITIIGSTTGQGNNSDVGFGEGFTYFPRVNFIETENLSLSVGIPLSVGISATTSSSYDYYGGYYGGGTSSVGFILNAPIILNLNMGRGSTKENRKKFGYFVGAGFGYHHGDFLTDGIYDPITDTYKDTYSSNTFGPAANGGVRLGVGRQHKNIEIRLSYMKGLSESKLNVFGLAGAFNF